MDAFFASVEQKDHPEWKGKPVIVGGLPGEKRSVVSTASYEARKYGVHSAMPVAKAVSLCPDGIYTHGNYSRYSEISMQIMNILEQYSPDVHQLSIDEASVELTGTEMLLGEPDIVAKKIRKEIYDFTGLTVSIGLASTAYLAKIASEVNKPNGFYAIPEGKEEEFMLSLPLKDVWGIGGKTLEKLHQKSFFTTKDIHRHSKASLEALFGKNFGNFLFNIVRGIQSEPQTPSSHSISNETTFPEDVNDIYTAETVLMELCHSVMFRLLKAKSYSKTVMIKIRYEDFSTFTVQQTFEDFVTTQDDLFDKAKSLFEKKYEFGRGIRLIGVGLENIQDENAPRQELLFDFGSGKKQAVEKAILDLEAKHPEIQIKKARLLQNKIKLFATIIISAFLVSRNNVTAEEAITKIDSDRAGTITSPMILLPMPKEAPETLLSYTIKDKEIEFLSQGWWQGEMEATANSTWSKENGFNSSSPDIVFKQQVDLMLRFMLNKQWYFEAGFADEFNKNTIAAGFYGKETNPLKEFRISNRNICILDDYSINLFNRGIGGGENQAPGFYARFRDPVNGKWSGDFAFRYDMTEQFDATWYGKNSVSTETVPLSNYMTGQLFTLPQKLMEQIKAVYVENNEGNEADISGRKFRKLSEDEFLIVSAKNMLIISKDSGIQKKNGKKPVILVTFHSDDPESLLGSYDDTSYGENISFLKEVQQHFGSVKLKNHTWKLFSKINDRKAVVLQGTSGFSPFIFANFYDLGITSNAKVLVGNKTSQEADNFIHAEITEEFENFLSSSFLNEKHSYAEVYTDSKNKNFWAPEIRYPAASFAPGQYLGNNNETELCLLVQKYTPVSCYAIGTEASEGSVKVYINGIPETSAKYDSESGTVTIEYSVSDLDKVYITWNEDSGDNSSGQIASQASFRYNFTENFYTDSSISALWTVSPFAEYSEYHRSASGQATLEAGIFYNQENFKLSNSFAATYEKQDVTGRYRIDGFENIRNRTNYFQKKSGHLLTEKQIPSINPRPESLEETIVLDNDLNFTSEENSCSGSKDPFISGYKIPLEWNISGNKKNSWAAINLTLPSGALLSNASQFRLALSSLNKIPDSVEIYLQLGVKADDTSFNIEEKSRIPTWNLTSNETDLSKSNVSIPFNRNIHVSSESGNSGWQYIQVDLTDSDRNLISSHHDARLIIVDSSPVSENSSGIIWAGPWEIVSNGISISGSSKMNLSAEQIKDNSIPSKNIWNQDDNFIQTVSWEKDEIELDTEEKRIITAKYIEETDLSKYRYVEFFYNNAAFSEFSLILDKNASSIENNGIPSVSLKLSEAGLVFLNRTDGLWHKLTIDLLKKRIEIDGMALPENSYELFLDKDIQPTRFKLSFIPQKDKDCFKLDELTMEESSSYFIFQDIAEFSFDKKGTLLSIKDFAVIQDPYFSSKNDMGASVPIEESFSGTTYISSTNKAALTVAGIKLKGTMQLSSKEEKIISSASQEISTARPIFDLLSVKDNFIFHHSDSSLKKESRADLSLNRFHVPLSLSMSAESQKSRWDSSASMSGQTSLNITKDLFSLRGKALISLSQKTPSTDDSNEEIKEMNYGLAYKETTESSFDFIANDARTRKIRQNLFLSFTLPWLDFSPEVSVSSNERYTLTSNANYNDSTTLDFSFPFKIDKQKITLRYEKTGYGSQTTEEGGDYKKDLQTLYNNYKDRDWLFKTLPFMDLFDSNFSDFMEDFSSTDDTSSLTYSGKYSVNWKRGIFADKRDIFIPSNFDFSAERNISKAKDFSDNYILKASLINTPINLFGKQSRTPIFHWYDTDEFAVSLSGTVKIPKSDPEDALWTMNFYAQSGFYMNERDSLKAGLQTSIETDSSWTLKASAQYNRRTEHSPLLSLIKLFSKKDNLETRLTRTDSLDLGFGHSTENKFWQNYDFTHKISAEMFKYFTITSGLNLNLKIQEEITSLEITGSLGGKITF